MKFPWWDRESVSLFDQILFLPPQMKAFALDLPADIAVEFCSGNGAWVVERALENKDVFWIAVEKKLDRAKKIWKRAKRLEALNLLVVCGRAEDFVQHVLPVEKASRIHINFPDPWPKRRHAKHRLIQSEFIDLLRKKMKKGGSIHLVSDDLPYVEESVAVLHNFMSPLLADPFYHNLEEAFGSSFFEELWRKEGRPIYLTSYASN